MNQLGEDCSDRVRVVFIDERLIVDTLNWMNAPDDSFLRLPTSSVPEDARVIRVWVDPSRRAIAALVAHDSFDRVTPGSEPPVEPMFASHIVRKQVAQSK